MGKLKSANKIIEKLHEDISRTIGYLEECVIEQPDNDALKFALLGVMRAHNRGKNIGGYEMRQIGSDNKWSQEPIHARITPGDGDWEVSIVRGGTKVRIHASDKLKREQTEAYEQIVASNPDCEYRNFKLID